MWLVEDRNAQCPHCGTRPDDWVDDRGRPLRQPALVAEQYDCHGCQRLADVRPDSRDPGVKGGWRHVRLVPYTEPAPDQAGD